MRFFSKVILFVFVITLIRLAVSCCRCENEFFSFNYNSLVIRNIDNSGQWSKPSATNEMFAASVAFEIQIVGSEVVLTASGTKYKLNGFTTLSAQSCNCDDQYIPNQTIANIHIRTLLDLNSDYCCNDEVTPLFLANNCIDCADIGSFYISIDELQRRINPEVIYHTPVNKFLIYLKVPIENDEAQFEIEIVFSDGRSIITQTDLISIV